MRPTLPLGPPFCRSSRADLVDAHRHAALCGTNNFGTITSRAFPSSSSPDDAPQNEEYLAARLTYMLYLDHLLAVLAPYLSHIFSSSTNSTLDGLVFSGGIGEKSVKLREDVVRHFAWIEQLAGTGGGIDEGKNGADVEGTREITKEGSKVRAWVVETSEEDEMVRMAEQELDNLDK